MHFKSYIDLIYFKNNYIFKLKKMYVIDIQIDRFKVVILQISHSNMVYIID